MKLNFYSSKFRARTLDNAFPKHDTMDKWMNKHAAVTHIFVDEFSMLHPKWFDVLHRLKVRKPTLKISFFGDIRQATPIVDKKDPYQRVNYETCAMMHKLTDGNRCILPYINGENARFDTATETVLRTLDINGTVAWGSKTKWSYQQSHYAQPGRCDWR